MEEPRSAHRIRYYLPPDLAADWRRLLPHLDPDAVRPVRATAGSGPDGQAGLYLHGPGRADETGWTQTGGGWWLHGEGCLPDSACRLTFLPGRHIEIVGALPGHLWLVPLIAVYVAGRWQSALPPVLGPTGYDAPAPYRAITARLTVALDHAADATDDEVVGPYTDLAIDLLALHYHTCRHDLAALGWLSMPMVPAILRAAAGLTMEVGQP